MSATVEASKLVDGKGELMEPKDSSNTDPEHLNSEVDVEASDLVIGASQQASEADSISKDDELDGTKEDGEQRKLPTEENMELLSLETSLKVNESKQEARSSELQDVAREQDLAEVSSARIQDDGDLGEESSQSNEMQKSTCNPDIASLTLRKDDGNKTFTMRELLGDLRDNDKRELADIESTPINDSERERVESRSPSSPEGVTQQQLSKNDASMELINNVTGVDEEGRSRQRILAFAAKRYATAIERNPEDHDAFYNWALVLQESADNVDADSTSPSKDALLEEACKKYEAATRICPTLHDAFYNWAIAISDRAKMRGRTKEAEELWKQATKNYEQAVQLSWNSPQALNNWGLALQELSAIVPAREKQAIVKTAISKFRSAIQLQFDFHRAIYNLGTVLYGLAEDTLRTVGSGSVKEASRDELYSQSAVYIAAAHALKPNYSVYHSALKLVRSMLSLPYLKAGYLNAPPVDKQVAPHNDWKLSQFVLNHEGLQQINRVDPGQSGKSTSTTNIGKGGSIKVDVRDIVSVGACADLTLPPGAGLCIDTVHGPIFLVADSWEVLDGWLDAIRLVYTIYARGKSDVLAGVLIG